MVALTAKHSPSDFDSESPGKLPLDGVVPKFMLAELVGAMFSATGQSRRGFFLSGLDQQAINKWLKYDVSSISIGSRQQLSRVFSVDHEGLEDLLYSRKSYDGMAEALSLQPYLPFDRAGITSPADDEIERCLAFRREMKLPVFTEAISQAQVAECLAALTRLKSMVGSKKITWGEDMMLSLRGMEFKDKIRAFHFLATDLQRETSALLTHDSLLRAARGGRDLFSTSDDQKMYLPSDVLQYIKENDLEQRLRLAMGLSEEEASLLFPGDGGESQIPPGWIDLTDEEPKISEEASVQKKFQLFCLMADTTPEKILDSLELE